LDFLGHSRPSAGDFDFRAPAAADLRVVTFLGLCSSSGCRSTAARRTSCAHDPKKESAVHCARAQLKKACQDSNACSA